MKVPHFRYLVEIHGVIEHKVSYIPGCLLNQLNNYDKYMLI